MSNNELLNNATAVLAEFVRVNPWGGHSLAFAAAHHDMALELADSAPGDGRSDAVVDAALRLSNFTKRWGGVYLTKDLRMGK